MAKKAKKAKKAKSAKKTRKVSRRKVKDPVGNWRGLGPNVSDETRGTGPRIRKK
jgi:hypothetical protein